MEENTQTGASSAPQGQSAQADLSAVAARAKVAAKGFDFNKLFMGRIDNMNFFYYAIASLVLGFVLGMIPLIGMLANLALLVLGIGLMVRRFHDITITGWAALIMFIPPLALLAVIYLCWKQGNVAANLYGEAPDPKRDFFHAVLNT